MADNSSPIFSLNQSFNDAALRGDMAPLQELLRRDPLLVHRSSTSTPLHVACKLGHVHFTSELLRLNPSLAEEPDPNDKSSPLHMASRYGHLDLVKSLVSISPSTCFSRDMNGMNPVHTAAVRGHLHVLDELLKKAPAAGREKVGPADESIMHLCVKYGQLEALRVAAKAVGDAEMMNATDREGNTVLHVAVANKQVEIVQFLLSDGRVKRNITNSQGLTAMDVFNQSQHDPNTDHQLKSTLKRFRALHSQAIKEEKGKDYHLNWLESQRQSLMVVASLIATMAYQAGLNPPGGSWQEDNKNRLAGESIMALHYKDRYNRFMILNTVGLVASMSSILLLISGLPCRRFFIALVMVTMWVAITTMAYAYAVSLSALTPAEDSDLVNTILVHGLQVWLVIMALLLLWHGVWWPIRFFKLLGRLIKKLFRCCFPRRAIV